jgi:NitT/TauT family transport system permease protein
MTLLPPPGLVFMRLAQQLATNTFQEAIVATLFRLFAGFLIAVILGVGIGLAAAASPTVNAVMRPIVRVLAPLPKVALYPALLLLLGFGHESKIVLVAADALFPILLSTYYGASMVEQKLIWSAMAAGTSRHQILFKVVLPAAVPSILTGCRIGLVISCIVVFLAEMITSTDGLGHLLVTAARTFQAVDMFVPLITISLLGLTLNALLQALRSYLLRGFPEIYVVLEEETGMLADRISEMDRRILRILSAARLSRAIPRICRDAITRAQHSSRRACFVTDGRQSHFTSSCQTPVTVSRSVPLNRRQHRHQKLGPSSAHCRRRASLSTAPSKGSCTRRRRRKFSKPARAFSTSPTNIRRRSSVWCRIRRWKSGCGRR